MQKMSMPSRKCPDQIMICLVFFQLKVGEMPTVFIFFQRVLSLELFGSKLIYFEDFQDYYGNFGKVQSKDCSPITNFFE